MPEMISVPMAPPAPGGPRDGSSAATHGGAKPEGPPFKRVLDDHQARTAKAEGRTRGDDTPKGNHCDADEPAGEAEAGEATSAEAAEATEPTAPATAIAEALALAATATPAATTTAQAAATATGEATEGETPAAAIPAGLVQAEGEAAEGEAGEAGAKAGLPLPGAERHGRNPNAATPATPATPGEAPATPATPSAKADAPSPVAAATAQATTAAPAAEARAEAPAGPATQPATVPAGQQGPAAVAHRGADVAPAAPPTPLNTAHAVERIQAMVHMAHARGTAHARLELHPAELGGVTIQLQVGRDGLKAHIAADRAEALPLLQRAAADLQQSLQNRGIDLAGLDFGLAPDSEAGASSSEGRAERRPGSFAGPGSARDGDDDEAEDALTATTTTRAVELPAGALVDVRA